MHDFLVFYPVIPLKWSSRLWCFFWFGKVYSVLVLTQIVSLALLLVVMSSLSSWPASMKHGL